MDSEKMENSCNFLTDGKSLQARCWAIAWKSKDVESKRLYAYKKSISKGSRARSLNLIVWALPWVCRWLLPGKPLNRFDSSSIGRLDDDCGFLGLDLEQLGQGQLQTASTLLDIPVLVCARLELVYGEEDRRVLLAEASAKLSGYVGDW